MTDSQENTGSENRAGILIVCSFILAIVVANLPYIETYYHAWIKEPITLVFAGMRYSTTVLSIVNDFLMTFFFLLIGLELKHHLVLGEYQQKKSLVLPTISAIGGIVMPAVLFIYFNYQTDTQKGWAIPIATDTAFMLGILSFFKKHIPLKLRAFVIGFSLIDDAVALLILALFYVESPNAQAFLITGILIALLGMLNHSGLKKTEPYLFIGIFLWIAMVEAGIHGTLAGAVLALMIPLKQEKSGNPHFYKLENNLKPWVHYGIVPLFVFINSGIQASQFHLDALTSPLGLGIILGLFIGKPLGVFGWAYAGMRFGWCQLDKQVSLTTFLAIGLLSGIGFTLSLFIGDLSFSGSPYYEIMRVAVIVASLLSAFGGVLLLYYDLVCKSERG